MTARAWPLLPLALWLGAASAQDHAHRATQAPQAAGEEQTDPHAAHRAMASHVSAPMAGTYQVPPLTDADRAAAFPVLHARHDHRDPLVWMVQADRFEYTQGDTLAWSGKAWIGRDRGRLWLRSEGERSHGHVDASLEALWGRPLDAWWDVLAGLRHDTAGPGPARDWLALGVQGLAPYKFEVQATAYLGSGGRSMLRAEAEYELLLTNRLILQTHLEAVLNGRADPARGTGAGLAQTSQGLRLRYELRRELAPYFGYAWTQRHGGSVDRARLRGEPVRDHGWVAGVRFWF
ncbi:copper resistance protein B [Thermomonas alba]|uniref:copper resistance protein B n=1 Tax=Thermomonas alba TaxID=2888525 RepID=UPI001F036729|nr:copper resistance protein B [Thermomonas alba]